MPPELLGQLELFEEALAAMGVTVWAMVEHEADDALGAAALGDSSDGFPGLPGWGSRSASSVLARYRHLEEIPAAAGQWDVAGLRGAPKLAATLQDNFELALLFRRLATLVTDVDVGTVESWRWAGPTSEFTTMAEHLEAPELVVRAESLAKGRA
jgi:5'-3' exonuclease